MPATCSQDLPAEAMDAVSVPCKFRLSVYAQ